MFNLIFTMLTNSMGKFSSSLSLLLSSSFSFSFYVFLFSFVWFCLNWNIMNWRKARVITFEDSSIFDRNVEWKVYVTKDFLATYIYISFYVQILNLYGILVYKCTLNIKAFFFWLSIGYQQFKCAENLFNARIKHDSFHMWKEV